MNTSESYAEEMGEPHFDWHRALDLAHACQPVSTETYVDLCERSASWATCACGNQCDALPRTDDGIPVDEWLAVLGARFAGQITDSEWLAAKATLLTIESRASELLDKLPVDE